MWFLITAEISPDYTHKTAPYAILRLTSFDGQTLRGDDCLESPDIDDFLIVWSGVSEFQHEWIVEARGQVYLAKRLDMGDYIYCPYTPLAQTPVMLMQPPILHDKSF